MVGEIQGSGRTCFVAKISGQVSSVSRGKYRCAWAGVPSLYPEVVKVEKGKHEREHTPRTELKDLNNRDVSLKRVWDSDSGFSECVCAHMLDCWTDHSEVSMRIWGYGVCITRRISHLGSHTHAQLARLHPNPSSLLPLLNPKLEISHLPAHSDTQLARSVVVIHDRMHKAVADSTGPDQAEKQDSF